VPLTCSIGLCTVVPHHSVDARTMIEEADKALYRAKHGGRDQAIGVDTSNEVPRLRKRG